MSFSCANSLLIPAPNVFGVLSRDNRRLNENNNNQLMDDNEKIQEIWNKHTFRSENVEKNTMDHNNMKVNSWINDSLMKSENVSIQENEKIVDEPEQEEENHTETMENSKDQEQNGSPSHHARRPMNAFLIFCKKHRPIVRDRFPNLENRGVTKILGEWWSLLEENDKTPFTYLANEYKDAFLSANPDFKWYKLPAPPLRSLLVRPSNLPKLPSPQLSPSQTTLQVFNEFTPGKLADESQMGSITSLLNNNFTSKSPKGIDCCENKNDESLISAKAKLNENNNELEQCDISLQSPVNLIKEATLPPKPIKKRLYVQVQHNTGTNTKEVSRNILNSECNENQNCFQTEHQINDRENMTNQDIVDKVVDTLFIEKLDSNYIDEKTRKSGRQCKGKRYEKFMVEGKLLGNKKETKLTQNKLNEFSKETSTLQLPERKNDFTTPNLENTIKRLAERTKLIIPQNEDDYIPTIIKEEKEEVCSETSETSPNSNFNLDVKINNLPSLSYDAFIQKKKDSKKRKLRKVCENTKNIDKKMRKNETLVGSKKRKNKHSITHLEKKEKNEFNDLIGLATLAEVAANTQKINEK